MEEITNYKKTSIPKITKNQKQVGVSKIISKFLINLQLILKQNSKQPAKSAVSKVYFPVKSKFLTN